MTPEERNLLLTVSRILHDQMQSVADMSMKSVGMVRGPIREHLPALKAALSPFDPSPKVGEPTQGELLDA